MIKYDEKTIKDEIKKLSDEELNFTYSLARMLILMDIYPTSKKEIEIHERNKKHLEFVKEELESRKNKNKND